jgi:phosphoglycerate dehydrogenase-like enzyme
MRLAILDDYLRSAKDMADWGRLENHPETPMRIDVFDRHLGDEASVASALAPFNVLIAMRERTAFPASLFDKLPELRLLVTTGMRNLSIDMAAARARGIDVCGTAMTGFAAAEHSWALVMGLAKQLALADRTMKAGGWQAAWSVPLKDKTLGLLGLGRLGAQTARYARAFGMRIIAWSQNLSDERAAECGAERVGKETLFKESDFVVIHLVLSDRTRGLVGAPQLAQMKPTAYLVNTSRGPIVDEAALIEALSARRIAGAGIDVYDREPLPADHALRRLDNALLTGHTGYMVWDGITNAYAEAIQDVEQWLAGKPIRVLNAI